MAHPRCPRGKILACTTHDMIQKRAMYKIVAGKQWHIHHTPEEVCARRVPRLRLYTAARERRCQRGPGATGSVGYVRRLALIRCRATSPRWGALSPGGRAPLPPAPPGPRTCLLSRER
eukprot:scaffold112758_cov29-Tisochrysis_lutea.AAC.5